MTNDEVMQKMEEDFILRNLSERTRNSYRYVISRFHEFTGEPNLEDLNESDLRRFLLHLRGEEGLVALTTSNQYNSACKFLLRVVLCQDINPTQVPNARTHHKMVRPLSIDELELFFSLIENPRDFAFFLTLYGTGLRTNELRTLKYSQIVNNGDGNRYIRVINGKGDKERVVNIPDACYLALRLFWKLYQPDNPNEWMFPAEDRLSAEKPNFYTNRFTKIRDKDIRLAEFHQHCLRHTYAVHSLQYDSSDFVGLMGRLGHKSPASTIIYLQRAQLDKKLRESPAEICGRLFSAFCKRYGYNERC